MARSDKLQLVADFLQAINDKLKFVGLSVGLL